MATLGNNKNVIWYVLYIEPITGLTLSHEITKNLGMRDAITLARKEINIKHKQLFQSKIEIVGIIRKTWNG